MGALLGTILALWSCSAGTPPPPRSAGAPAQRIPVVLVPGVTGTELLDAETAATIWGTGWGLLFPRDRGHRVALPLVPRPGHRELVAGEVLDRMRLGPFTKAIYGPVEDWFRFHGWRPGDLRRPDPLATYFPFAYDWRQSNLDTASLLRGRLEELARVRGEAILEVDLICQSNGAHVCRYLARYGAVSLEEAEAGGGALPPEIRIRRMVLVGASNGGSLRIFAMLHRGRRYLGGSGKLWSPETLFSYPSFFQDLPAYREDLFVDPSGAAVDASVWRAADWLRFGWSVFDPDVARRLGESGSFGTEATRRQHLREQLEIAGRFQRLLRREGDLAGARLYVVESVATPTPDRAVLVRRGEDWDLRLPGDRGLDAGRAAVARLLAPGDNHATHESVWHLPAGERAGLAARPLVVDAPHFEMILEPETLSQLVAWLGGEGGG